jgi:hypothetical protein
MKMTDSAIPFHERISCTVPVACEVVGLGPTKMYELIADGRVKTKKVDGRRLVIVDSLRSLISGEQTISNAA